MQTTRQDIENTLREIVDRMPEGTLYEAAKYALLSGGKRLRPLLFCAVLESYRIDPKPYLEIASSVEMIHNYSLIHDDLPAMDDDDLRRGRPTVHRQFDEATAILTGDALLTDAFKVLASQTHIKPVRLSRLIDILATHSGSHGIVHGQSLDLAKDGQPPSIERLRTIHIHKTARLLQAPLMMAATLVNDKDIKTWQSVGESLGLAFQIQDDLLEITGAEETTGKSMSDERNKKTTYATLLGIKKSKALIDEEFAQVDRLLEGLAIDKAPFDSLLKKIKNRHY